MALQLENKTETVTQEKAFQYVVSIVRFFSDENVAHSRQLRNTQSAPTTHVMQNHRSHVTIGIHPAKIAVSGTPASQFRGNFPVKMPWY